MKKRELKKQIKKLEKQLFLSILVIEANVAENKMLHKTNEKIMFEKRQGK